MNKHSLLDDDVTIPDMEHGNVFGDEHEVDDFDGVADGFRPGNERITAEDSEPRSGSGQGHVGGGFGGDVAIHSVSAHYSSRPVTPTAPSRNSIRKSRDFSHQPNPFSSPEDDDHDEPRGSLQFEPDFNGMRRSFSTTSSRMFARTNSPRQGASGPSHPYGMYQQGTMLRSPSTATASTVRPLDRRLSSLPRGPQHPYSMYPQGVDEDLYDEEDDEQQSLRHNPIPVGFPGLSQNYVRRLGPDGEEQDIVGADGHTEQLPPYSRYPDEGPEKMPLLMPTALHSRAPVAGTDPTMPLMHTMLQPTPAPQSMTDVSQLSVRHNSMGSVERLRPGSVHGSDASMPKNWKGTSWREKANIKFCGIPFWCYVLALIIISAIATVLGIVIGGFVANHGRNGLKGDATVTFTTSLFDASIIASPTSVAPSTGTYALSLGAPQQTQAQCLVQAEQQLAWDCNIVPSAEIALIVGEESGGPGCGANISYAADIQIAYGAQASYMNTSFSTFLTVTDMEDPDAGPAFFFSAQYDKVVVVPEDAIDPVTGQFNPAAFKRDTGYNPAYPNPWYGGTGQWGQQKQVAQPSDKPWFCVWNGTYLEGFIYVSHYSNWTGTPTSHYTPVYPTTSSTSTTPPMSVTSSPSGAYSPPPTGYYSKEPYATSSPMPTSMPGASYHQNGYGGGDDDDDGSNYRRQAPPAPTNAPLVWNQLPVYPYLVKIEERRLPTNAIQPYCQQYQILDNGNANWAPSVNGTPIIVNLTEHDPSFSAYESAGLGDVSKMKLRNSGIIANECHCQWISGGNMPGQGS